MATGANVTQSGVEVFAEDSSGAKVAITQSGLEIWITTDNPTNVTQAGAEIFVEKTSGATTWITQSGLEIWYEAGNVGGLLYIDRTRQVNKDQYYTGMIVEIPDPTVRTALLGD